MTWNIFLQNMKEKNKAGSGRALSLSCLMAFIPVIFFLAVFSCMLSACSKGEGGFQAEIQPQDDPKDKAGGSRLYVVTTIFPPYDFVREIGGDNVSLKMLLKPGEETHSYEPTPQDILSIQKADLFLYVGGENDAWVEDILDAPEMEQVRTLRLVDCVDTLEEKHVGGMKTGRHMGDEAHEVEEDEHVWTSPKNAVQITERITEELIALDRAHQKEYESRLKEYTEALSLLDAQFRDVTEKAAQKGRRLLLFGDRFPFRYFAEEYGLEYYAAFPGCASDTEPSAATMAFLIRKVEEEQIPVVLKMELSSGQIANAVAEATGARVRVFYSCHNLTAEQFEEGCGYLSMMQENVETLKEALNGG